MLMRMLRRILDSLMEDDDGDAAGARFPPGPPVMMLTMRVMLTRMTTRMMKKGNPDTEVFCLASFCC